MQVINIPSKVLEDITIIVITYYNFLCVFVIILCHMVHKIYIKDRLTCVCVCVCVHTLHFEPIKQVIYRIYFTAKEKKIIITIIIFWQQKSLKDCIQGTVQ